jgi:hypothetical protein
MIGYAIVWHPSQMILQTRARLTKAWSTWTAGVRTKTCSTSHVSDTFHYIIIFKRRVRIDIHDS